MPTQKAADFTLPSTSGNDFRLTESGAKAVVVYFYPKDNTPGCTTEALAFRDHYKAFRAADAEVVGVSRDSLKSHASFKSKMSLPFELLADEDETVCNEFAVIKMKNLYGRQVRGIERSTFVIGPDRKILKEWRGVKVPGHVEEVLAFVKAL
jgi:thioredoxin-dependent peroxiredoxin